MAEDRTLEYLPKGKTRRGKKSEQTRRISIKELNCINDMWILPRVLYGMVRVALVCSLRIFQPILARFPLICSL